MKMFWTSLGEHVKNIIDNKYNLKIQQYNLLPLGKKESKLYQDEKVRYICRKRILKNV